MLAAGNLILLRMSYPGRKKHLKHLDLIRLFQLSLESMSKLFFEDEAKVIFQNSLARTLTLGEAFDLELQTVTKIILTSGFMQPVSL